MYYFVSFFVIIQCLLVYQVVCQCDTLKPEPGFSNRSSSELQEFYGVRSLGGCYHRCPAKVTCMSFFHNRQTGHCGTHSTTFLDTTPLQISNGSEYYKLTNKKCGRGNMFGRKTGVCMRLIYLYGDRNIGMMKSGCDDGKGGKMLTVDTEDKQELVERIMLANKIPAMIIGLIRTSKVWKWANGQQLHWHNWALKQPTENGICAYVRAKSNFTWDDAKCRSAYGTNMHVACEYA